MPLKKKIPLTDDEKFQAQLQQEFELQRYQRQYMHLHKDRNQFSLGTKFIKQHKVLDIFAKEHQNILTDLDVASAPAKKKDDVRNCDALSKLLQENTLLAEEAKEKQQFIKEITERIKIAKKEVQELQAKQTTDRMYEGRVWFAVKTVEGLENKLELQTRKFCGICSENRILREQINHLLLERERFMKLWNKIINKLNVGKKFMIDLIEQATIAYDQREDWCSKLQALRMKAHHDFLQHTNQMRLLKRKQDDQKKLEEFFDTKGQKRIMRDLHAKEQMKRHEHKEALTRQMEKYQEMMSSVQEFSGEKQVEKIIDKFSKQEEKNMMLFRLITDLITDMETITDNLGLLQMKIDEKRSLHEARTQRQKSNILDLETKLSDLKSEESRLEEELNSNDNNLSELMHGIGDLFNICKCSSDPLLKLLGDHQNITWYNVQMYQNILEDKVQETIVKVAYKDKILLEKKKISASQKVITLDHKSASDVDKLEKIVDGNPCPLCVEYEMVSDVIDSIQCVYTLEGAKRRLAERLKLPDALGRVHNVSACHLPKSREIIQKRYT